MFETIKENKWKIAAIILAVLAVVIYLYPKKEVVLEDIKDEKDEDNVVNFETKEVE